MHKSQKRLATKNPFVNEALLSLPALTKWLKSPPNASGLPKLHRLSVSQTQALLQLYLRGPQTISQLADGVGLAGNTMTEAVNALEALGRVSKTRSNKDGRAVVVRLEPSAVKIVETIYGTQVSILHKTFAKLSKAENPVFAKGLKVMAEAASEWLTSVNDLDGSKKRAKHNKF